MGDPLQSAQRAETAISFAPIWWDAAVGIPVAGTNSKNSVAPTPATETCGAASTNQWPGAMRGEGEAGSVCAPPAPQATDAAAIAATHRGLRRATQAIQLS